MTIWTADDSGRNPEPTLLGANGYVTHRWPDPTRQSPLVSTGDALFWMGFLEQNGETRLFRSAWNSTPQIVDLPGQDLVFASTETYTALNGRLIFSYRNEPWITGSDGLSASRLANLRPERFIKAVTLGNRAYLLTEGSSGAPSGLWSTDGTEAGTVRISNADWQGPLLISGDRVYFRVFLPASQYAWGSTTGDGTVQITPPRPTSQWGSPIPFRGGLLFSSSVSPFVLGSSIIDTNISPAPAGSQITRASIQTADGEILVWSNGNQLFRTDGTPGGTYAIEQPGGGALTGVYQVVGTAGGRAIFEANRGSAGTSLFASDGSRLGTSLLASIAPRVGTTPIYTTEGSVVRWRSGPTNSPSFFESEGSNDRSTVIGPGFGIGSWNTFPAPGGVFRVIGIQPDQVRVDWASSTLEEGVEIGRVNIPTGTSFGAFPGMIYEDRLVFVARGRAFGAHPASGVQSLGGADTAVGSSLVRLDDGSILIGGTNMLRTKGTPESTTLISNQGGTFLAALSDDKFIVRQTNSISGLSAGRPSEYLELQPPASVGGQIDRSGTGVGDRALLAAARTITNIAEYELWSTDGTLAGTSLLLDIYPGPVSSDPGSFVTLRGPGGPRGFFFATSPEHGREPWISDGTLSGTSVLRDIAPGALSSQIRLPLTFTDDYNEDHPVLHIRAEDVGSDRDYVIFYADAPGPTTGTTTGVEPWISDGTPEGTRSLGETFPGAEPGLVGWFPPNITSIAGDFLYLAASSLATGTQLFAVPLGLRERNLCDYDYNRDGNVDSTDAQLMAAVFVGQVPTNPAWFGGDLDASGNADLEDAQRLARYVVTWVCE